MKKIIAILLLFVISLNISIPIFASEIPSVILPPETETTNVGGEEENAEIITPSSELELESTPPENSQEVTTEENSSAASSGTASAVTNASLESDFDYTVEGNEAKITAYYGIDEEVVVPSSIDGFPVTSLKSNLFSSNKTITSVVLPEGIEELPIFIFWKCSNLQSVTLPSTLTSIGKCAFLGCSSLESVTLPNNITNIGEKAFMDCSSLLYANLPTSLITLGASAFYDCKNLTSVVFGPSTTTIGANVFYNCKNLKDVTLPEDLTSISVGAFRRCTTLASVVLPANLQSIDSFAFAECSALLSIEIPNNVTTIGDSSFLNASSLTKIIIPKSVTTITPTAFSGCNSINVHCYTDSITHQFVLAQNIPFTLLDASPEVVVDNDIEVFITRVYKYSLNRSPSNEEKSYWKDRLENGLESGSSFVSTLFFDEQFLLAGHSNRSYVIFLYNAVLGREPDAVGLEDWVGKLNSGISRPNLLAHYLITPEFSSTCARYDIQVGSVSTQAKQNANLREFIVRTYRGILSRSPGSSELDSWYNELRNDGRSTYYLVYGIVFSQESISKTQSNDEYVKMLYRGLLGRDSGKEELASWSKCLRNGSYTRVQVFDSFFYSTEFRGIQSNYGL